MGGRKNKTGKRRGEEETGRKRRGKKKEEKPKSMAKRHLMLRAILQAPLASVAFARTQTRPAILFDAYSYLDVSLFKDENTVTKFKVCCDMKI